MLSTTDRIFLDCSARDLRELVGRIETCLDQLTDEQVWTRGSENQNAAGNLALHLAGNVRQWIVSGLGGKPDARDRASEFRARGGVGTPELAALLRAAVEEAAAVIERLSAGDLSRRLTIQGYEVSGLEAVYHVVEHFSMHTGQILFLTKMLTGTDLGFYRHLDANAGNGSPTP